MSFILDALRRAQNANEHAPVDRTPIFADRVPDAPTNYRQRAAWLAGAIATLCFVAALAWWFGRVSVTEPVPAAPAAAIYESDPAPAPGSVNSPRAPVRALDREVGRSGPAQAARATNPAAPAPSAPSRSGTVTIQPVPTPARSGTVTIQPAPASAREAPSDEKPPSSLPQYENLLVAGEINLPNLKMDMHVYSDTPSRRFVFINFKKYREGERLNPQTAIEEITTTGAVLNHNGQRFLLRPN